MRIRTIKPDFWKHPIMGRLKDDTKLAAIGLLNLADDEGFFSAAPEIIRAEIFPFTDSSRRIHGILTELSCADYIEVREHPKQGCVGRILNFLEHQVVNRPRPSKLLKYFNECDSLNSHGSITEASPPEWKGMEGNGREWKFDPKRVSSGLDWLDDELWAEWIDFKRKVKASLSERAIKSNIKKLISFGTENATAVISKSLDCGWKDLFPLEGTAQHRKAATSATQSPANLAAAESWARILERVRGTATGRSIEFTDLEKLVLKQTKSISIMKSENEKNLPFSQRDYLGAFVVEWGKRG